MSLAHIALRLTLVCSLLFGQLVVNLLHDAHDYHADAGVSLKKEAAVQKHGEHCKVCSLEIFFNLLTAPADQHATSRFVLLTSDLAPTGTTIELAGCLRGRAPPLKS